MRKGSIFPYGKYYSAIGGIITPLTYFFLKKDFNPPLGALFSLIGAFVGPILGKYLNQDIVEDLQKNMLEDLNLKTQEEIKDSFYKVNKFLVTNNL